MQVNVIIYSMYSGLATVGGGLLALLMKGNKRNWHIPCMLSLAAGVMGAVVLLDLVPESLVFTTPVGSAIGFVVGVLLMFLLDLVVPHLHRFDIVKGANDYIKTGMFVAIGIALHNLPEGLAIGAGFQAAPELGFVIAGAIALHNIPEGLGMAVPLCAGGMRWSMVLLVCLLAGIFTPIGTIIGMLFLSIDEIFIGLSLALAAGAMSYIVVLELLPESWKQSKAPCIWGFAGGMLLAVLLH